MTYPSSSNNASSHTDDRTDSEYNSADADEHRSATQDACEHAGEPANERPDNERPEQERFDNRRPRHEHSEDKSPDGENDERERLDHGVYKGIRRPENLDFHVYYNGKRPSKRARIIMLLLVCAIMYFLGTQFFGFLRGSQSEKLATNEFVQALYDGRVSSVVYKTSDSTLSGEFWKSSSDIGNMRALTHFTSAYAGEDRLSELMENNNSVTFRVDTSDGSLLHSLIFSVAPTLVLLAVFIFYMRSISSQNGRAMSFGKTKALTNKEERPKVRFSDVAGIDEAVEEVQEVRDFLSNPKRYENMGAKIPHGVLLQGPPGTGKTLLAKAVAGEAGVPFFSISGSDFVEMFVGVGASRVRDLFQQAKEAAPCIVFIDEIDAVGRERGAGFGGGHDEREQTLNQLLVEMDGFEDNSAVILMAATNRPDVLDPALLRPGRFDRQIIVDRPDMPGRRKILAVHAEGKPLADDVDLDALARLTPGFTGADLANLMNEAALLSARRRLQQITHAEIQEAMERVIAGPERKSRVISEEERRTIAYHESGHALVGHLLKKADPVHKISIISRGQALGYTLQSAEEDRFLETRSALADKIAVLLAGRTAEEIFCDDVTTGASNDLERVTKLARAMVTRYGMSDALGAQVFGTPDHEVFLGRDYSKNDNLSEATAVRIDAEMSNIISTAHERALRILTDRQDQMHTMAHVLLQVETIEGEALKALLENTWDSYIAEHPDALQSGAL